MNDFAAFAARTRRWGYVALGLSAVPGAALATRLAESGTDAYVLNLVVPLVILAVVGAAMVAVGFYLPRALAAGADPAKLPELRASFSRRPATLVVTLAGASVVFSALTTPLCACTTREIAWEGMMKSDLRNLQAEQEIHWHEEGEVYASSLAELGYAPGEGVTVELRGGPEGWSARATHARLEGTSCVIRSGEGVRPFRTLGGIEPPEQGVPFCQRDGG